ncbi:MAG: phage integrase N-terminal SAM-like domain-containing protein [Anaerostipes sp.]
MFQYTISACDSKNSEQENQKYIEAFIVAKRVEGCSEKTMSYYQTTIENMLTEVKKEVRKIITDDLRIYLTQYQNRKNLSKVTVDNVRRILSSFFLG